MQVINGKIVLGRRDCYCGDGKQFGKVTCATCKGTGKGKRGAKNGCQSCHGSKVTYTKERTATCERCKGEHIGFEPETLYHHMPAEIWDALELRVYRSDRGISGNESFLGLGCVFSCQDYGRAYNATDEAIIADVRSEKIHQACKVTKKDGTLCSHVGIFVNKGGYSVRPVFDSVEEVVSAIVSERPEDEYRMVGNAIATNGGNGTFGAL